MSSKRARRRKREIELESNLNYVRYGEVREKNKTHVHCNKSVSPNSESVDISLNNIPSESISSEIEDFDFQNSSSDEFFPDDDEGMIRNLSNIDQNTVNDFDMKTSLREWAAKHKITKCALKDLLLILNNLGCNLPKDPRTICKTPRIVPTYNH